MASGDGVASSDETWSNSILFDDNKHQWKWNGSPTGLRDLDNPNSTYKGRGMRRTMEINLSSNAMTDQSQLTGTTKHRHYRSWAQTRIK